jgi:hypothetical protein
VTEAAIAIAKLRRIEELWENLKGLKSNTPEYKALIKEIGALSAEYQKLVEAMKKPA